MTIVQPTGQPTAPQTTPPATGGQQPDPKRPYGGLVPSQPKGQRAYQDAATYNQHLAQHQAYTAQAQAASQFAAAYVDVSTSSVVSAAAMLPSEGLFAVLVVSVNVATMAATLPQ